MATPAKQRKPRGAGRAATKATKATKAAATEVEEVTTAADIAPAQDVNEGVVEEAPIAEQEPATEEAPASEEPSEATEGAPEANDGSSEESDEPAGTQEGVVDESLEESTEVEESNSDAPLESIEDVRAYLEMPDISIDTKLRTLATRGNSPVRGTASVIVSVVDALGPDVPEMDPPVLIGRLFTLYTAMKEGVECADTAAFHLKMDVFHLAFMAYGDQGQAFDQSMLLRYDYLWQWGDDSLKTYQVLVVAMSTLANRSTRVEMRKRVNLTNSFARTGLSISQQSIDRLINYYEA